MEPGNRRQAAARARQEIEVDGAEEIEVNRLEEEGLGEETMKMRTTDTAGLTPERVVHFSG